MRDKLFSYIAVIVFTVLAVAVIIAVEPPQHMNDISNSASANIYFQAPQIDKKVDINTATKAQLMNLPGIGETKAELIIANRPYEDTWELLELDGLGTETFKNIVDSIEV